MTLRNKAMPATNAADVAWRRDFIEPPCLFGVQSEVCELQEPHPRSSCECGSRGILQTEKALIHTSLRSSLKSSSARFSLSKKNAAGKRCATPIVPADVRIVGQGRRACKEIE